MLRYSVFAALFAVIRIPCGTVVVSGRRVNVCTCVSVLRIVLGLLIMCVLTVNGFSGLGLCDVLVVIIAVKVVVMCEFCYTEGCDRTGFEFIGS